jgi:hypothetical protein
MIGRNHSRRLLLAAVAFLPVVAWAASGGPAAANASAEPLAGITVGIDPGHNGGNSDDPSYINRGRDPSLPGKVTDLRNLLIRYGPASTGS